ncbi:MAG: serine/threonine-protein kinase [Pseudomonadota bacterium]
MPKLSPAEVERRALGLLERLDDLEDDPETRARVLAEQPPEVRSRLADLQRSAVEAADAFPTGDAWAGSRFDPPERVGPFRLVRLLGQGGMGAVWLAERDDGLFEQRVAVKFIHAHLHAAAGDRFAAERRILARLEHPGIARIIDGGVTANALPYLVMEYVEGRPIDVAAQDLGPRARAALFGQAVEAAQYAHGRLVAHADLKPGNILVDRAGRVRLLDFGVARLIGDDDVDVEVPMTRAYASPRRQAGEPPTIADDVYALGVVLDGLVAEAGDADLAAIAAKARAESEAARYGSAAEVLADLDRWRDRLPVKARPQTVAYRAARFLSRHRLGVGLTAAAMLLLAVAAVTAWVNYLEAERARAEADARFADVRGTARYLLFELSDELERLPGALPLRTRVAEVSQGYLDRLTSTRGAPAAVRLESAEGLLRLAERQGAPGGANLGQPRATRANYRRALATLSTLSGADADRLRARAHIGLARLEATNFNDFPNAEAELRRAEPLVAPAGAPAAAQRGRFLAVYSELRQWQGRYPEAIALADRALAAAGPASEREGVLLRADLANMSGDATFYSGDHPGAVPYYRRQVDWLARGVRLWPDDISLRRRLSRAHWALASTLLDLGRPAQALAEIDKASLIARDLVAAEPTDADALRMVRINDNVRAQSLAALGRTDEALAILRAGADARRRLWQAEPDDASRGRDYAIATAMIADVEADAGRSADACARYDEVTRIFGDLRRGGRFAGLDDDNAMKLVRDRQAEHCR